MAWRTMMMSEPPRSRYLDHGDDASNMLNRSWDVESRYRLQEKALNLPKGEDSSSSAALFRVQIELGLHELTAALTSLSRRIDKLEDNTATPDKEKQGGELKELARNARCLSQALPGIASARTRRRALHGYFRESDEQRGGNGRRIDLAARALIVEGLASLAGKVRVEAARAYKSNGGSVGLMKSNTSRGLSPSSRHRTSRTRSTIGGRSAGEDEEEPTRQGVASRYGGAGDAKGLWTASGKGFTSLREFSLLRGVASEQRFALDRLEVEHLGVSLGLSLPPSPITLAGSADDHNGHLAANAVGTSTSSRARGFSKSDRGEKGRVSGGKDDESSIGVKTGSGVGLVMGPPEVSKKDNYQGVRAAMVSTSVGCGGVGGAANSDLMTRMPLNADGIPAEADQQKGGPGVQEDRQGPALYSDDVLGSDDGGGGGIGDVEKDPDFGRKGEVVRAPGSHVYRPARPTSPSASPSFSPSSASSSSSLSSSSSHPGSTAVADAASNSVRPVARRRYGFNKEARDTRADGSARAESKTPLGTSEAAPPRRRGSLLDVHGWKNPLIDGGGLRSLNSTRDASLERSNVAPLVDAQGFLDLGAARAHGEDSVGLAEFLSKHSDDLDTDNVELGVAELEAKLEVLRKIGDRIKDKAAAATMEPSLIIPSQDLTSLDPLLPRSHFSNNSSGSRYPPSTSRYQLHPRPGIHSERSRGVVPAATGAPSAFASAESSPDRLAEDSSVPVPPPAACDQQGIEAVLSRLVPTFQNTALRGEFLASLELHLAEYKHDKIEDDDLGNGGRDETCETEDVVAAFDGDDGVCNRNDDGDAGSGTRASVLATTSSVRDMCESNRAAEAMSNIIAGATTKEVAEHGTATLDCDSSTAGAPREKVDEVKGEEGAHETPPETPAVGDANKSSWAQEYHDYLCSKYP